MNQDGRVWLVKRWVDWGGVGDEGEEVEGVALCEGRVGG